MNDYASFYYLFGSLLLPGRLRLFVVIFKSSVKQVSEKSEDDIYGFYLAMRIIF